MATTHYLWDYANDSYLAETDDTGNPTAVYTTEPNMYGSVVSQRRGSTTSYFEYDGLGSERQLTDISGVSTDVDLYDAFGQTVSSSGATVNAFRWIGETAYYFDIELTAYYIRARMYDPALARWHSEDPLPRHPGSPALFLYSANAPLGTTDPSGEDFIALAHIPLERAPIYFHYSLEYWECCQRVTVGRQYDQWEQNSEELSHCQPTHWTELYGFDRTADVWMDRIGNFNVINRRRDPNRNMYVRAPIAFINVDGPRHGTSSAFMPIYDNRENFEVTYRWDAIIANASYYEWAERELDSAALLNWPKSLYYANGTNSRTFIVQMVAKVQLPWFEMAPGRRWHPGFDMPSQNDGYDEAATITGYQVGYRYTVIRGQNPANIQTVPRSGGWVNEVDPQPPMPANLPPP